MLETGQCLVFRAAENFNFTKYLECYSFFNAFSYDVLRARPKKEISCDIWNTKLCGDTGGTIIIVSCVESAQIEKLLRVSVPHQYTWFFIRYLKVFFSKMQQCWVGLQGSGITELGLKETLCLSLKISKSCSPWAIMFSILPKTCIFDIKESSHLV